MSALFLRNLGGGTGGESNKSGGGRPKLLLFALTCGSTDVDMGGDTFRPKLAVFNMARGGGRGHPSVGEFGGLFFVLFAQHMRSDVKLRLRRSSEVANRNEDVELGDDGGESVRFSWWGSTVRTGGRGGGGGVFFRRRRSGFGGSSGLGDGVGSGISL